MGFGLRNAGNTFQRMMYRDASGMPFIFVYLDDIIVGSRDIQSHVRNLYLLFERLRDYSLVINEEKCEFGAKELDFLGHRESAAGVAPLQMKVEAIPGTGRLFRHLGMQKVSFQGPEEFSDLGECKKDLWVVGKMSWSQQRDCVSLVKEFSDGKLKQKGFFYSVTINQ